ncbi:Serine/threonine-protein kinase CTR1 [Bienertia sinuspersici]
MAIDQSSVSVPMDLRPINVARSCEEETRMAPSPVTTSGRPLDGFHPTTAARVDVTSSPSVPMYYPDVSSAGLSSMGFVNPSGPNMGHAVWWAPRMPAMVGPPPSNNSPSGYAYCSNLGPTVGGGGGRTGSSAVTGTDQVSEDAGDDSILGKKVKFLCSFGGKILPRPSDGMLRYVGGQTRIISVRRDITFDKLVQKMADTYGQTVVIKYQLPEEDLDALVSVTCSDDLDNMMEEYEKLQERSPDGSTKLRLFLFNASELDPSGSVQMGSLQDNALRYVDAVNGVAEGNGGRITRKESIASVASTQNSDVSGSDFFDTAVAQDVSGPPHANMFSPRSDPAASYDNALRLEVSAPPFIVPAGVSPHSAVSEPEIERERVAPVPAHGQQQPIRYDLQQLGLSLQPHTSSYLGGHIGPSQDALSRGASQVVYANAQFYETPRPVLIHPQHCGSSPNLLNQQFVPSVHMTLAPNSPHLSMNPNLLQPLAQPSQRVVAIPSDPSYINAYQTPANGGYKWPQVTPQDHAAFSEGWMSHQQVVPTTVDCYMCQKTLPHSHSDTVAQDQKVSQSTSYSDPNSIYQSRCLDEISRLNTAVTQNQGMMGLTSDAPTAYCAVRRNVPVTGLEDTPPQHLVSKPVSGAFDPPSSVVYHPPEQFIPKASQDFSGKVPVMAFREDSVRSTISNDHVRPVDFRMENPQMRHVDILPVNEQDKSLINQLRNDDLLEHVPQTVRKEALPSLAFSIPTLPQETSQLNQNETVPCSVAEVQYQYNDISPGSHLRSDDTRVPAETVGLNNDVQPSTSPRTWDAIGNDSTNSLFSNQDPWNMRHEYPFPPPKPSKIAIKREAPTADNRQNEELYLEANFVEVPPITEQAQPRKGSAEEQIKQQLQATAEGVAASVLHSFVSSNVDCSSQEMNFSEPKLEIEGQTNSDAVIKTKMEAMNIQSDKTNFGFPLSGSLGRLQIIKNDDLEELRELGSGTFGTVYHGKWRGTDVAIKRINDRCFAGKPSEQERMRDDFWNEAIKLADLHHPNVVAFYGVVLDGPGGSVATVTEYMVNGSLRTALQKNERNLEKRKRLLIAMDVAFGMEYLHSKNIVHFDLKSDNLLVNLRDPHRPICKVGDLGLSKVKCQTLISGGVRGTLPWMAPELLNGNSSLVSEKVDVFSFGIVMWELLTGEEPYADLHYGAIIGGIVNNTLRPEVPENCDPGWRSLMERCWSAEPPERPNFTEIASELRQMASKALGKGQTPASTTRTNS